MTSALSVVSAKNVAANRRALRQIRLRRGGASAPGRMSEAALTLRRQSAGNLRRQQRPKRAKRRPTSAPSREAAARRSLIKSWQNIGGAACIIAETARNRAANRNKDAARWQKTQPLHKSR